MSVSIYAIGNDMMMQRYHRSTCVVLFNSHFRDVIVQQLMQFTKFNRNIRQGCESSNFNLISDFCSSQNPIFRIEKHIFSGISDYFRLFLTDALTPLIRASHLTVFVFKEAYSISPYNLLVKWRIKSSCTALFLNLTLSWYTMYVVIYWCDCLTLTLRAWVRFPTSPDSFILQLDT